MMIVLSVHAIGHAWSIVLAARLGNTVASVSSSGAPLLLWTRLEYRMIGASF